MDVDTQVTSHSVRAKPAIVLRILQWVGFAFALFVLLGSLIPLEKSHVPGVSIALIYSSIAAIAAATILLLPAVFWRLPKAGLRWGAYAALFTAFLFVVTVSGHVAAAYDKTPEGAREAAKRKAEEDKALTAKAQQTNAAQQASAQAAEQERVSEELSDLRSKLEACFSSWGHELPALRDPVRDALHNPRSFEHVKTELIVPDAERNNVAMIFRAENGFGAIRTGVVKAQLNADDCSVQNIGQPITD